MSQFNRFFRPLLLLALGIFFQQKNYAQSASDVVVPITVSTSASPASISLAWTSPPGITQVVVARKLINQTSWTLLAQLPATATSYTDATAAVGTAYEYLVLQQATGGTPSQRIGLVYAGIRVSAMTGSRGKIVLVVDSTLSVPLAAELTRLESDLRGDGWQPIRRTIVPAESSVGSVKTLLRDLYNADVTNTRAAFLIGDIPVPYSGNINPDGHPEHQGAWPTDYYYGDMDEDEWTDGAVNNPGAARPQNRNVPNDGKFDQSQTPTLPELVVSRVDFSNLSDWDVSQTELYRRYLDKNHRFRVGAYKPQNKALVDDNFGYFSGEAFAQNGWRNGYALVGPSNTTAGDFFTDTDNTSYLVGYGTGSGTYVGAAGVGTSDNFKTDSVNIVFSMLFGSYHGDWDYAPNPFMPSALASKGGILTCAWAGRPNWFFHHMGMGQTIGTSASWVWLNSFLSSPVYPSNFGADLVHVGLLGDPTLRAHSVVPPSAASASSSCNGSGLTLTWAASPDANEGYLVYKSPTASGVYTLLTATPVSGTSYTDATATAGLNFYQIKALRLEEVATGSYFNQSIGVPVQANYAGATTPLSVTVNNDAVPCVGDASGSVVAVVSGGAGNYSFLWNNAANTQTITDLSAGTYTVTVTDGAGCTRSQSAQVTQPAAALSATATSTNVLCFGAATGTVSVSAAGGTVPYFYEWSGGFDTPTVSNLPAGTYAVTIFDSNLCETNTTVTVTQPAAALAVNAGTTNLTCFGANDGTIDLTLTGGTAPYAVDWSDVAGASNPEDRSDLAAGTYAAVVTDANGCSTSIANLSIGAPAAITSSVMTTNAACGGGATGSVTLTVGGGAGGFSFLWSNAATTQNLQNVPSGDYLVTITDANNCTSTAFAAVVQNTSLVTNASSTGVACFGDETGSASVSISGGQAPYGILWSNAATNPQISGLQAGTYTVTVTDATGCTQSATASVASPAALSFVLQNFEYTQPCGPATQQRGQVLSSVVGGVAPYTFLWSNGSTQANLTNVAPAIYTTTITDANGCTTSASHTLQVISELSFTNFESGNVDCAGGTDGYIAFQTTGGTLPYTFDWSDLPGALDPNIRVGLSAGTYQLTITDANGCQVFLSQIISQPNPIDPNVSAIGGGCVQGAGTLTSGPIFGTPPYSFLWSNQATTATIGNLLPGTYTVTVTDANQCTASQTASITLGTPLAVSFSITNASCSGSDNGTIGVSVTGGSSQYNFNWSPTQPNASVLTNLAPGTYTVTVTDLTNGCTGTSSGTVSAPPPLGTTVVVTNVQCNGDATGAINLNVTGGTSPYAYDWADVPGTNNTEDRTGLPAGLYTVTITDANNCTANNVAVVSEPLPIVININGPDTACVNQTSTINASGLTSYNWILSSGTIVSGQGTNSITVLWNTLGTQTVSVLSTDANGCTATASQAVFVDPCVSTHEATLPDVQVWPNPFTTWVGVSFENAVSPSARLRVFDLHGRVLLEKNNLSNPSKLDTQRLPSGQYLLRIEDGVRSGTWRLVKM
jgi:SprB repeat/Secretion system C-terminal sorting domain